MRGATGSARRRRRNEDDADGKTRRQHSCTRNKRSYLLEPTGPPKNSPLLARQNRGCGEVDTASASGAEDPEFESRHPHFLFFCLYDVEDAVLFPTSHFARRTAKYGGGGGRRSARGCAGVLKLGKFSPIAKFSQIADRNRPSWFRRAASIGRPDIKIATRRVTASQKSVFVVACAEEAPASDLPRAARTDAPLASPRVSHLAARAEDG